MRGLDALWQRASERFARVGAASPADLAAAEAEHDDLLRLARALQTAECAAAVEFLCAERLGIILHGVPKWLEIVAKMVLKK